MNKAESPTYYKYRMQVHKIMQGDLEPSFHASYRLEVDYEFYLDPHGDLTRMKVHAKAGGKWAEQVVARSIRRIKCPPIPPKVFKEIREKPPLKNLRNHDLGSTVTGLTRRWSQQRTAIRATFEITSTLPLRATRASSGVADPSSR